MRFFERVHDGGSEFAVRPALEPQSATVVELINLILGADLGQLVLQQIDSELSSTGFYDRLRSLLQSGTSPQLLGLTPKRMAKLQAAVELGKRLYCAVPPQGTVIDDPAKAAEVLQSAIGFETVEKFAVLVLDVKHRLLSREIVSSGTVSETLAHPRDVFRAVILGNGCRCIIAHNHPSGSVEASPEDIGLTRQMLKAAQNMGIPVLDHLVISHGQFCSIRQTTGLWAEVPQGDC